MREVRGGDGRYPQPEAGGAVLDYAAETVLL